MVMWYHMHQIWQMPQLLISNQTIFLDWPKHLVHCKYLELHPGRHHDGSEGERVWADGSDHDGWDVGMDHGSSCCHCIRCTSCRCRYYHTWGDTETHAHSELRHNITSKTLILYLNRWQPNILLKALKELLQATSPGFSVNSPVSPW